ncbi:MAG TPA: M23 family metallopeptidase [Acidimicrobiales bacterium]|jgi:murein DD-endopeptidase MepM/ murein hydrolase activator NlpD|nr:M23 family metallopeptidase [Acidimicrobiales bacterium]
MPTAPTLRRTRFAGRVVGADTHRRSTRFAAAVLAATALFGGALVASAATRSATSPHGRARTISTAGLVHYVPPVAAPVVDPFRAPASPYGPGNRGIEYATAPGTTVGAAAAGTVTFAGRVAGSLDVTILHADGIRTSYVGLATIEVRLGQRVTLGEPIGTSGARLHVGARRGDVYLDPATLWSSGGGAVLVPLDGGR